MLSLSLLESTRELHPEPLLVDEIIAAITPDMEFEAESRGCSFVSHIEPLPAISGNSELLRRAIENVTRNAIRFTASGSQVNISAYLVRDALSPGPAIEVQVQDRGPGVPEVSLPYIFRAFYRTDPSRREATGGFGVGLAERAVLLHRGQIRAANLLQGGLEVKITLPIRA